VLGAVLEIDARLFGLGEEFDGLADSESVIRSFFDAFHIHIELVDDIAVLRRFAGTIVDFPAQRLKEGIDELDLVLRPFHR
jgi:hypothetical protein